VLLRKIVAFQALAIFASMEFAKQAPKIDFFVIQLIPKLLRENRFARRAQRKCLLCSPVKSGWKSALRRGISALQPAAPLASSTV
jgi:hypothetical protein